MEGRDEEDKEYWEKYFYLKPREQRNEFSCWVAHMALKWLWQTQTARKYKGSGR